ncbi:Crotonobetainyl-CoA:carnitine CoA-transferase CaiB [Saccharopolyspora antimicrobica]|uniref:Crotonobetainyl-CoA:carnitine CoA-transferase CaiB n=1 Tax=Saccharopolyspora antimicrobica TaxID=455193 RepID=A0A1I4VNC0_9PSEU|nr:CoA transferase [Saccharopolyspora antimicrobica]RKT87292.1 crotonobetainyl-CoA:carnitine CoA-transferase CaiB-like acyl-CoA transferase [Saccharopolyspora antimicrobica]SFN02791.1 Crotonobetainyl-CoA:carnitine CoA-transferase CaiB [Saccharopolyspora antimicrobica]
MTVSRDPSAGALAGLRVVDASTLFAGPMAAMHLGDMGAEVIKVEHPAKPDPSRTHGVAKDGVNLWWKTLGRNKRTVTADLADEGGREVFLALAATADVVIENFRPGTLERWGLGYEELSARNPGLVLARVTGFGQLGPYRARPGFGTLAEAMSGFAATTGEPDGPPTLPPFGLADGVASLATAFAIMVALSSREQRGRGQVVDVAIIEPILAMLGPQITRWDQLRTVQPRTGNRSTNNAPRNTYRTSDGHWVAVSTSAQSVAERVVRLVGRPDLVEQPWFASGADRARHADELDEAVGAWIAQRTREDVVAAFEAAQAAIAPIYDAADIVADPQFRALGTIHEITDPELGPTLMQGPLFRLSGNDGVIGFTGRPHGADTGEVLDELGFTPERIAELRARGAV